MNKSNKQRLIILSDLWGEEKSDWVKHYTSTLEAYFDVKYYDSCVLGEVDKSIYSEKNLHQQFISGGIEKAVANILKKETENTYILGFSIGGLIAWKACNSGLKMQRFIAVSTTRLRYETQKPSGEIELFYGEEDPYKPDSNWFKKMEIKELFYKHETHEFYKKIEVAESLCKMILAK